MKYRSCPALVGIALLTLTACTNPSGDSADTGSDSADTSAPDSGDVVARVNDEPITQAALDAQVQAMSQRGQKVQPQQALDNLIQLKLMTQKAESQDMAEQADIQAKIKRQRASLLAQHLIRAKMSEFEVDDEALRKAYDERVAGMANTEYKASHILLEDEETAQQMIDKLDDGADFTKLAKDNSTGPTKEKGGELGWFSADQMVGPFVDAVKDMEPGDYSDEPVKSQYGWHVIQFEDSREADKPAFDEMKPKLRNQIVGQKIQEYITGLREDADVEISDKNLESGAAAGSTGGDSMMQGSGDSGASSESDAASGESGQN